MISLPAALVVLGAMALAGWAMYLREKRPRDVAAQVSSAWEAAHAAEKNAADAMKSVDQARRLYEAGLADATDAVARNLTRAKEDLAAQGKKHREEVDAIAGDVVKAVNQLAAANALTRRDGQPFAGRPTLVPDAAAAKGVLP